MAPREFSHVVIGAGSIGSGAAYWLSELGSPSVLLLEQFHLGHEFGSSGDHSRIIRHSYHSADYTRLTPAAYEAWEQIEAETGLQLVFKTGGVDMAKEGTSGAAEVATYRQSLAAAGIGWDDLDADQLRQRWPQFEIADDVIGMYQEDTGILDIRKACAAHISLARRQGVEVLQETAVVKVIPFESHVELHTAVGPIIAETLVLCPGAYAGPLLSDLGVEWNLFLSEEQVCYFATPNIRDFTIGRFPVWVWHSDNLFYGFPVYGELATKAARDMRGKWVTMDSRSMAPDPTETQLIADFVRALAPGSLGPELVSKKCLYDMPPDRNFVLGPLRQAPRVIVGLGAGHAAKFGSLLGRILGEYAIDNGTKYPVEPFTVDRPALTDPNYEPFFRLSGPEQRLPSNGASSDS